MIRTTFITSLLAAVLCSGCASPETVKSDKYMRLEKQPQPKTYTLRLTGSRIRVDVDENDPSPDMLSPMNVIYGGDVHGLPWVDTSGR